MIHSDRITKMLLAFIAIFLGVLVFKSVFQATPLAAAVTTNAVQNLNAMSKSSDGTVKGFNTLPVSVINLNPKAKVISVQVMDIAQSFVVQYVDHIEVYRVDTSDVTSLVTPAAQQ